MALEHTYIMTIALPISRGETVNTNMRIEIHVVVASARNDDNELSGLVQCDPDVLHVHRLELLHCHELDMSQD